jgi:hypothetical protein
VLEATAGLRVCSMLDASGPPRLITSVRRPNRTMSPDTSEMIPVGDLVDDAQLALARKATAFLTAFRWCAGVKESFLAFDIGYPLGVFLFCIEPRLIGVDDILWVVVGDCPPAFLVCDVAPDWIGALRRYVYEMQRWVEAVRTGKSVHGIIPVNVAPTLEHADMLSKRLGFLQDHYLDGKPYRA